MEKLDLLVIKKEECNSRSHILGIILFVLFIISLIWPLFINVSLTRTTVLIIFAIIETILALIAIIAFKDKLKEDLTIFKSNFKSYFRFNIWKIIAMYLVAAIVKCISMVLTNQELSINQTQINTMPIWYLAIVSILLAPIVEECVFRGVTRRYIKSNVAFIIISSLLFGFGHSLTEASIISVITMGAPYVVFGIYLAIIYSKTNNLANNIFAHMLLNTISTIFTII